MAVLGLRFCVRAFSSCGKWGPLFIAVRGPLTIAASLVVEHRLQTHRLSDCGSRAQLLRGMWDLPRPGLKPVSPALSGRFSTTAPPGKPPKFTRFLQFIIIFKIYLSIYFWLHWVFIAACRLSLVATSRVYSSLQCAGFSLQWLLLLWSTGSRRAGFSSCGTWASVVWHMGSVVVTRGIQSAGSVVVMHGLSCSTACGIFPDQGSNLCPLHWQADS